MIPLNGPTAFLSPQDSPEQAALQLQALLRRIKPQIHPGTRGADELISYLQGQYSAHKVQADALPAVFLQNTAFNALQRSAGLTEVDLQLECFVIARDARSERLYAGAKDFEPIYVILERRTAEVFSPCSQLHLELIVARGVSQQDYDAESPALVAYLRLWEQYQELVKG